MKKREDMIKKFKSNLWAILICLIFIAIGFGCTYINGKLGQPDDWVGEELMEEIVKSKTGIDIDFTPETIER